RRAGSRSRRTETAPMTHAEALGLASLPEHLIVIGGGYIGLEMAQAFRRLGSRVTLLQDAPRVAMREDADVTAAIEAALAEEGIDILVGVKPLRVSGTSGRAVAVDLDDRRTVAGTHLLVATGRVPVTSDLGLDAAGVAVDSRGFI